MPGLSALLRRFGDVFLMLDFIIGHFLSQEQAYHLYRGFDPDLVAEFPQSCHPFEIRLCQSRMDDKVLENRHFGGFSNHEVRGSQGKVNC